LSVGRYYNFTSSGPGSYRFDPVNVFKVLEDDGSFSVLTADTTPTTVNLSGKLSTAKRLGPNSIGGARVTNGGLEKRITYNACSVNMRSQISLATNTAAFYASRAVAHLTSFPSGSPLQTTWFGAFSRARRMTVFDSFSVRGNIYLEIEIGF